MSPEAPIARLCAEVLSTGSRCKQFTLKGQHFCYAHADPMQRERNADARQLIVISKMDVFAITLTLSNTVHELRTKVIPPLHAQAIFDAVPPGSNSCTIRPLRRPGSRNLSPSPVNARKPNSNNGLHVASLK